MPNSHRLHYLADALRIWVSPEEIHRLTRIDPWFINAIAEIVAAESKIAALPLEPDLLREAKTMGFSDRRIAELRNLDRK